MKKLFLFSIFFTLLAIFTSSFAVMQASSTYSSSEDFLAAEGGICKLATDGCNTSAIIDGQLGPTTLMACLDDQGNMKAQVWSCLEYNDDIMFMTGSPIVGNDADEHGCIGSAGYTWNEAQKSCLRLWEQGLSSNDQNFYLSIKSQLTGVQKYQIDKLFGKYQSILQKYDIATQADINEQVITRLEMKIQDFLMKFPQDTGLSYKDNMTYFKLSLLKFEMKIFQHMLTEKN